MIHKSMQERTYSTESWSQHELHPTHDQGFSDVEVVNFVFTMDLLNFSWVYDLIQGNQCADIIVASGLRWQTTSFSRSITRADGGRVTRAFWHVCGGL